MRQPEGTAMPLRSILDGSGAFYIFVLATITAAALILCAGISIGRALERHRRPQNIIQERDAT